MRKDMGGETGSEEIAVASSNDSSPLRALHSALLPLPPATPAEPTPDEEYESRKARVLSLERLLEGYVKYFNLFLDGVRGSAHSSNELANLTQELYADCQPAQRATVSGYCTGLRSFDAGLRPKFDSAVVKEVVEPLQRLLAGIADMKKGMRERELVKLDYDAHYRRAKDLKEKGTGGDPAALLEREQRMQQTQHTLQKLTEALFRQWDDLEAKRHSMVAPSLRRFTALQRTFYEEGVGLCTRLIEIPEMAAAVPVYVPSPALAGLNVAGSSTPAAAAAAAAAGGAGAAAASGSAAAAVTAAPSSSRPLPVPGAAPGATAAEKVVALHQYKPTAADELALEPGQAVLVLEKHADGWWKGRNEATGKEGVFPSNFVQA